MHAFNKDFMDFFNKAWIQLFVLLFDDPLAHKFFMWWDVIIIICPDVQVYESEGAAVPWLAMSSAAGKK